MRFPYADGARSDTADESGREDGSDMEMVEVEGVPAGKGIWGKCLVQNGRTYLKRCLYVPPLGELHPGCPALGPEDRARGGSRTPTKQELEGGEYRAAAAHRRSRNWRVADSQSIAV